MKAALALADRPIPHCADPAGLYSEFVIQIYSAGYAAHSARSLSGLLQAAAQLKTVKKTDHRLAAEVKRVAAKSQ